MGQMTVYSCDQCGKVSHDYYEDKWLKVYDYGQRRKATIGEPNHIFCSWKCLRKFID
jgi:hypothetical protein